jgi:hypothetical protein
MGPNNRLVYYLAETAHVVSVGRCAIEIKLEVNDLEESALCHEESVREVFLLLVFDGRVHRMLQIVVLYAQVTDSHSLIEEFACDEEARAAD